MVGCAPRVNGSNAWKTERVFVVGGQVVRGVQAFERDAGGSLEGFSALGKTLEDGIDHGLFPILLALFQLGHQCGSSGGENASTGT